MQLQHIESRVYNLWTLILDLLRPLCFSVAMIRNCFAKGLINELRYIIRIFLERMQCSLMGVFFDRICKQVYCFLFWWNSNWINVALLFELWLLSFDLWSFWGHFGFEAETNQYFSHKQLIRRAWQVFDWQRYCKHCIVSDFLMFCSIV